MSKQDKRGEMILSLETVNKIQGSNVEKPGSGYFQLPEKVLQFGTGVLLRGLPDYFIDKANKQGLFNGRIVVVKSTSNGGVDAFDQQNALYTQCIRGVENGQRIEENIINASISRVLSAKNDWDEVLRCAANQEMQIIISNTTEVGITLVKDNVHAAPPVSFPGKLLAFLYQRYKIFDGDATKGMVIIPTELVPDNGDKLESIVLELAHQNGLETAFIDWLEKANHFCNSLVDRIVPGKLPEQQQSIIENELGYRDELMIMSESYSLWAIESGDERVKELLSFSKADAGVVIAPCIETYRELKLRLLNGSHTFSCGLAFLAAFSTVRESMEDEVFEGFMRDLLLKELVPSITSDEISAEQAIQFASNVLDRYKNPHIDHYWLSITMQYTSKMRMRNIPLIVKYVNKFGVIPPLMSLGFAAYLLFMKTDKSGDGKFQGKLNGDAYTVTDDHAELLHDRWKATLNGEIVHSILSNTDLWGYDLSSLSGFENAVKENLHLLQQQDALTVIKNQSALGGQVSVYK